MKTIMLENVVTPRSQLKTIKDMAKKLNVHSWDTLYYAYHQNLLKSAAQIMIIQIKLIDIELHAKCTSATPA